jgi:hypothetical protein
MIDLIMEREKEEEKKNKENCFEDTPYEKPPYNTE